LLLRLTAAEAVVGVVVAVVAVALVEVLLLVVAPVVDHPMEVQSGEDLLLPLVLQLYLEAMFKP
jgi:hypothetical protein